MSENTSAQSLEGHAENGQNGQNGSGISKLGQRVQSLWGPKKGTSHRPGRSDESTPLLARDSTDDEREFATDGSEAGEIPNGEREQQSFLTSAKKVSKRRLATIISLVVLCVLMLVILGFGFAAPQVMEEYAKTAAVFQPTKLSIDSFTTDGLKARVQGDFYLNGTRVKHKPVRDIGRALSWIAGAVESKETEINVSLPEYDITLGNAVIPPIAVSLKEMETTSIDEVVEVIPGDPKGLKQIVSDWLGGRLGQLIIKGESDVALQSGILPLGTHHVSQVLTFMGGDVPSVPEYSLSKIKVHEIDLPGNSTGLSADVSISAFNKYPVSFVVPPLAFEILVPGCSSDSPFILVANATTRAISIEPEATVTADARGIVRQLPESLLAACPGSSTSPLDTLISNYIEGSGTKMYVRGSSNPLEDTPAWIADIMRSITVAVPVTGKSMSNLIRNFSMEDTHFSMPNPLADPESPEGQPRISTEIFLFANLPEEINFPVNVSKVRSLADVYYEGKKFGVLELQRWQDSSSRVVEDEGEDQKLLAVQASIKDAPLGITDQGVFTEVIQQVLFGEDVTLKVKAKVDAEIKTALGTLIVREIPGEGKVPLKPLLGDGFLKGFAPAVGDLEIRDTTATTIGLIANVNFTNPTPYSADVPFVNINVLYNDTVVANISMTDVHIHPRRNSKLPFTARWDPRGLSGREGAEKGRDLLSKHISALNTSISLRTHKDSFPSVPWLGAALSSFEFKLPTPSLRTPHEPKEPGDGDDNGDDDGPHFIQDATMHLFTSTADFTLQSPFRKTTLFLTYINATAFYNGTDSVGAIEYDLPIEVPPGATRTPRLPVNWSLDSVGYGAVKDALGGTLKLSAKANVTVRIGSWTETVHFLGRSIGAHITI